MLHCLLGKRVVLEIAMAGREIASQVRRISGYKLGIFVYRYEVFALLTTHTQALHYTYSHNSPHTQGQRIGPASEAGLSADLGYRNLAGTVVALRE